jgi:hypothetical protein
MPMTDFPPSTNTEHQAGDTLVPAAPAATSLAQDSLQRRRGASGATRELVILIGHEPAVTRDTDGWQALAPGAESGRVSSPWRAIADAIWRWHCAGRPSSAGIYFAGAPHPFAVGTVAEDARTAWTARTGARSAA